MGARKKLNAAHFLGSLALACVAGAITESWLVFIVGLVVLVGIDINNGDIRLRRDR